MSDKAQTKTIKRHDIVLVMPQAVPLTQNDRGDPIIVCFANPILAEVREVRINPQGAALVRCNILRSVDLADSAQQCRSGKPPTHRPNAESIICLALGLQPLHRAAEAGRGAPE